MGDALPLFAMRFHEIVAPTFVFFATDDDYVSPANRDALIRVQREHQRIELLADYTHSDWTYDQAESVIAQTADFLERHFRAA